MWTRVEQLRGTLNVSEVGGRETKQLSLAAAGGGQHDAGGFLYPSFNGSPGVHSRGKAQTAPAVTPQSQLGRDARLFLAGYMLSP